MLFQMWRVEVEAMKRLDRLEGDLLEMSGELRGVVVDMGGLDDKEVKVRGRSSGMWRRGGPLVQGPSLWGLSKRGSS